MITKCLSLCIDRGRFWRLLYIVVLSCFHKVFEYGISRSFLFSLFGHSTLHAAKAKHSPSPSYHPAGGSHLRPERVGGAAHDGAWEEPAGQIQAAAGQSKHWPGYESGTHYRWVDVDVLFACRCVFISALCCYRGAPEAQLVGHTQRSPANHMETSLRKSHDLEFLQSHMFRSALICSDLGLLHRVESSKLKSFPEHALIMSKALSF